MAKILVKCWRYRFLRFLVVGGINTCFSYGTYALLLFLGIHYAIANLAALMSGILFSFKTQGKFVFNNSDNRLLWRFVLFWGFLYGFNVAFIDTMMKLGLNAYWAGALTLLPNTILSYLAQKHWVFIPAHP